MPFVVMDDVDREAITPGDSTAFALPTAPSVGWATRSETR